MLLYFFLFRKKRKKEAKASEEKKKKKLTLSLFPSKKFNQGGYAIPAGSDLFLSVWNLHRDPGRWKDADDFIPERFGPVDDVVDASAAGCPHSGGSGSPPSSYSTSSSSSYVVPNEITESFSYLPFGGGKRKCIGDQFALFESVSALAIFARRVSLFFLFFLSFFLPPSSSPSSSFPPCHHHHHHSSCLSLSSRGGLLLFFSS